MCTARENGQQASGRTCLPLACRGDVCDGKLKVEGLLKASEREQLHLADARHRIAVEKERLLVRSRDECCDLEVARGLLVGRWRLSERAHSTLPPVTI